MPLSSIERKKRPKASVSDLAAEVQSVTGPGAKNQVNIEPTRLLHMETPASLAAATNSGDHFAGKFIESRVDIFVFAQIAQGGIACGHREGISG